MRTIKFRGKRVDNGVWVYGKLNPCDTCPTVAGFFVNPKTVWQFTGFHDTNNGNEGDSAGCGSVLIAWGEHNAHTLKECGICGKFIKLNDKY